MELCYTIPERDDLTVDTDERDVYDYETDWKVTLLNSAATQEVRQI